MEPQAESVHTFDEASKLPYVVFGPKLIATRGCFHDRALESRCLTEETGGQKLRNDIPINLTSDYKREALELRSKLLMFRFRSYGARQIDAALAGRPLDRASLGEDFSCRS